MVNRLEILRDEIDKLIDEDSGNYRMYISHMYGVARFCTLLAMKRELNVELATTCGMLHDICYMTGSGTDDHAARGAQQAETILRGIGLYSDYEIAVITDAISKHGKKLKVHGEYAELLKDADVMDHCLYNLEIPIVEKEIERYNKLLEEFVISKKYAE